MDESQTPDAPEDEAPDNAEQAAPGAADEANRFRRPSFRTSVTKPSRPTTARVPMLN